MKAHRHRLIFWPLFCGVVVFMLSGKGSYGLLWPNVTLGMVSATALEGAIYGSDPSRHGSGIVRLVVVATGVFAVLDLFLTRYVPDCDMTILFFLVIFAVPLAKATFQRRTGKTQG